MNRTRKLLFGEAIVAAGHVERDIVERALEIQRQRDAIGESHKLLGLIMLEMGAISNEQLIATLKYMQRTSRSVPKVTGS
ncbi:MAG: hypothetical protein M9894_33880 [Planctomycetes bacterium]|nr:hypothetical protein [Planctomycetota bacterium]